jgi:hypothetical protein
MNGYSIRHYTIPWVARFLESLSRAHTITFLKILDIFRRWARSLQNLHDQVYRISMIIEVLGVI